MLLVDSQELRDEVAQVVRVEVGVLRVPAFSLLGLIEGLLERVAGNVHHDLAEHLDEAA